MLDGHAHRRAVELFGGKGRSDYGSNLHAPFVEKRVLGKAARWATKTRA